MKHIAYSNAHAHDHRSSHRRQHFELIVPLLAVAAMMFSSCLDDGDQTIVLPIPEATIPTAVLPTNIQDELDDNGFDINTGTEPPTLDGTFVISPMQLVYASDNYDPVAFYDTHLTFSDCQKRGAIKYTESQSDSIVGKATYAHIIGHDDYFTVYCNQELEVEGSSWHCTTTTVISGRLTDDGITDLKYALVLLDSESASPDTDPSIAPNGTVRIFADGDGTATRINQ